MSKNKLRKSLFLLCMPYMYGATNIDMRCAGFVPISTVFRSVYGPILPSLQVQGSWNISDLYTLWVNVSYIPFWGKSCPLKIKAQGRLVPISLGINYLYCVNQYWHGYCGGGICYSWLHEKNNSTVCNKTDAVGGIFKVGFKREYKQCVVGFFGDYLLQNFCMNNPIQRLKINTQGLLLGVSIGKTF